MPCTRLPFEFMSSWSVLSYAWQKKKKLQGSATCVQVVKSVLICATGRPHSTNPRTNSPPESTRDHSLTRWTDGTSHYRSAGLGPNRRNWGISFSLMEIDLCNLLKVWQGQLCCVPGKKKKSIWGQIDTYVRVWLRFSWATRLCNTFRVIKHAPHREL